MTPTKLKIPKGLATAISNSRPMQRAMAAFICLKAMNSASNIPNYRKGLSGIATACNMSQRTLETRISDLKLLGIAWVKDNDLYLASWDRIWTQFNIPFKSKQYWYYENKSITFRMEYLLKALSLREKTFEMSFAFRKKLDNMLEVKQELKEILGLGANQAINPRDVLAGQIRAFADGTYTPMQQWILNLLNPDNNVSCTYLQSFWGYSEKASSGPSYMKRKLAELKIISVAKRQVQSNVRTRQCVSGSVFYCRTEGATKLQLPDEISFLPL